MKTVVQEIRRGVWKLSRSASDEQFHSLLLFNCGNIVAVANLKQYQDDCPLICWMKSYKSVWKAKQKLHAQLGGLIEMEWGYYDSLIGYESVIGASSLFKLIPEKTKWSTDERNLRAIVAEHAAMLIELDSRPKYSQLSAYPFRIPGYNPEEVRDPGPKWRIKTFDPNDVFKGGERFDEKDEQKNNETDSD